MLNAKNPGFTIVELLVVIVVIGVLAAVTMTTYNGLQERAHKTIVRADLSNAAKKIALFEASSVSGPYPTTLDELTLALSGVFTKDSYQWLIYCTDSTNYSLAAKRPIDNTWHVIGSNQGLTDTTTPGITGNQATTCANLGYPSPTYANWIKSTCCWRF